jgi:hypothetical protein
MLKKLYLKLHQKIWVEDIGCDVLSISNNGIKRIFFGLLFSCLFPIIGVFILYFTGKAHPQQTEIKEIKIGFFLLILSFLCCFCPIIVLISVFKIFFFKFLI